MSADFTRAVKAKGWQMQEVAKRWGVTPRQLSRIAAAPKQIHWDAIAGLPEKGEALAQSLEDRDEITVCSWHIDYCGD